MELFRTEKLTDRITRIFGVTGEIMYLCVGTRAAVLIDTGVGIGDLPGLVKSITDKPLTVLLTHGHVDHAMGAGAFTDIRMHPAEVPVYSQHQEWKIRKEYAAMFVPSLEEPAVRDAWREAPQELSFLPAHAGDVLDVGGLSLELLDGSGHTPGTLCVLIREERMLLLGDACNVSTFLFDAFAHTISEYSHTLLRLKKHTEGRYDRALFSHGPGEGDINMVEGVLMVCSDILEGKADDVPFPFLGKTAYLAKRVDSHHRRVDGGVGNIVYPGMNAING